MRTPFRFALLAVSCLLSTVSCLLPPSSRAASTTTITNYYPGYVLVTQNWDLAASGLSTSTAYACIPLTAIPAATAAALAPTGTTSDVRILLYAIQDAAYTNYFNTVSTNRPDNTEISKDVLIQGTTYRIKHTLETVWSFTAILTLR